MTTLHIRLRLWRAYVEDTALYWGCRAYFLYCRSRLQCQNLGLEWLLWHRAIQRYARTRRTYHSMMAYGRYRRALQVLADQPAAPVVLALAALWPVLWLLFLGGRP